MLLIRFLNLNNDPSSLAPICDIVEDQIPSDVKAPGYGPCRTFSVKVHAVTPDFKVLLYAFHQGDALPQTAWNGNQSVRIAWPDQEDQVGFSMSSSGKTDVSVFRGQQSLVVVNHPIPELPVGVSLNQTP